MTQIRAATGDDEERIVELSLAAWEPVFASMRDVVGDAIFRQVRAPRIRLTDAGPDVRLGTSAG